MKCLSVRNPLSYLICAGVKDVENRTQKTNYRGKILIHSCGKIKTYEIIKADLPENVYNSCRNLYKNIKDNYSAYAEKLLKFYNKKVLTYYGIKLDDIDVLRTKETKEKYKPYFINYAIIGEVEIIDCVKNNNSPFAEKDKYNWILKNPKLYKDPIMEIKGSLGLWNYNI